MNAIARHWEQLLTEQLSTERYKIDVEVEVDWTEEGDWSLSWEYGANIYGIHATDARYNEFAVLLHCPDRTIVLSDGIPLQSALHGIDWRQYG